MNESRRFRPLLAAVFATILLGCPDTPPDDTTLPADTPPSDDAMPADGPSQAAAPPQLRATTEGLWTVNIIEGATVFPAFIVRVKDGVVTEVEKNGRFEPLSLVQGSATEEAMTAKFLLKVPEGSEGKDLEQTLTATLGDGVLRGNLNYPPVGHSFVVLTPSETEGFQSESPAALASAQKFGELTGGESVDLVKIREYLRSLPADPIQVLGMKRLLGFDQQAGVPPEQFLEDAAAYRKAAEQWGEPYVRDAVRESAVRYATYPGVDPETARKMLAEARGMLPEDTPEIQMADLRIASAAVDVADPEIDDATAEKTADRLIESLPSSPMLYALRAQIAERLGDTEAALRAITELSVLPNGVYDINRVGMLYQKARGSIDGIEDYLMDVYKESLIDFVPEGATYPGKSPALVELYTGQACPPCVAADVAVRAAEVAYGQDIIALRYHMDIPQADPLTTAVGRERFKSYGFRGTPTVAVNGEPLVTLFGSFPEAPDRFEKLTQALTDADTSPEVSVTVAAERLSASRIKVSASAAGVPTEGDCRLLVVLASDEVMMPADNGIRIHEMVVRDMPSGPDGVPSEDGAATLDMTLDTVDSRNQIINGMAMPFTEMMEEYRPAVTDFGEMSLVAFVQDLETMKVLAVQRTAVPPFDAAGGPQSADDEAPANKPPEKPSDMPDDTPSDAASDGGAAAVEVPAGDPPTGPAETSSAEEEPVDDDPDRPEDAAVKSDQPDGSENAETTAGTED